MKPIAFAWIGLMCCGVAWSQAQTTPPPAAPAPTPAAAAPAKAPAAPDKPPLKAEELEQLLASIALYPDPLITQVLMASTYPLEIVQADRWAKSNKDLKGDPLAKELEKQTWDPSVKSLVNFPEVLAMMSEKLDLTIKIGDAFISQQADVMNTIQKLRGKAKASGNLKTNEQQKVIVEQAPPTTQQATVVVQQPPAQVIKIEPTQPNVIYVPSYSPTVVYGTWPYPYYPPAPYYPPSYVASNVMSFGVGVACGMAWGYAWGNCNWGHGDVDIDVNRNTNINTNIDRSKAQANIDARRQNAGSGQRTGQAGQTGRSSWQHDSSHRQGVPYRDQKTASEYGRGNTQASAARDQYRGHADAGRADLNRGAASDFRGTGGDFNRGGGNVSGGAAGNRGAQGNFGSAGSANRATPYSSNTGRGSSSGGGNYSGQTFNGMNSGGSSARASSSRGQASRSSSGYSGSSGGGGSRGGGGGSRGGGGARGGGGRR